MTASWWQCGSCGTDSSNTLGQISQSARQVADGSEQISSETQLLAIGAEEQACSIEKLAAAVNEII